MMSWQELLAVAHSARPKSLGPYTLEFASALIALEDTPWFAEVGHPIEDPSSMAIAASWDDALSVLRSPSDEYSGGHLAAPMWLVIGTLDRYPDRRAWVQTAYGAGRDRVNVHGHTPPGLVVSDSVELGDHVHEYLEFLLMEIAVQDVTSCTYFREQLAWWHGGHFPCGWVGNWPAGKMRVF